MSTLRVLIEATTYATDDFALVSADVMRKKMSCLRRLQWDV